MIDSDTDHSPAASALRRLSASAPAPAAPSPQRPGQPAAPRDAKTPDTAPATPATPAVPEKPGCPAPGPGPKPGADRSEAAKGFSLSNFFDSIHEPDWEAIGDRVMATPATLAEGYRGYRTRARERAARKAVEQEATRLALIQAQAAARTAQEAADKLEAETRARAEAERAEQEILEAERRAAAAVVAARQREEAALVEEQRRAAAEVQRAAREKLEAEQAAVAAHQADIEAHRAAERARLEDYGKLAANDDYLRRQGIRDAELTRAAQAAHLPPPPTAAERLAAEVAAAQADIRASRQQVYVAPYTLPSTAPNPPAAGTDRIRQIVVSVVALLVPAAAWQWVGFGPVDGAVDAGQTPSPARSLLHPAVEAQLIWPVLFIGFVAFAIHQWLPAQHSAPRQRAVGYLAAAAMVLGGGWLWAAHSGLGLPAALFAVATVVVLQLALRRLNSLTARTPAERAFTDAPLTGFLGWMLVPAAASVLGLIPGNTPVGGSGPVAQLIGVLVIAGLVYLAMTWAMSERGRVALAVGFGWGMFWVVIARLFGSDPGVWVALAAGAGAFVVLVSMENRRYQIQHAEHRAARGQRTMF